MKYLLLLLLGCPFAAAAQELFSENRDAPHRPLDVIWQLDSADNQRTFSLSAYLPLYVLPVRWSSSPNRMPTNSDSIFAAPSAVDYQDIEAKIQISVKSKIAAGLFGGRGDVWVTYTQQGYWQIYNVDLSRPFRELNYEPQLLFNYRFSPRTDDGLRLRMAGVSLVHQSNGLNVPLTRSWNRVIFHAGLQSERWTLIVRPWLILGRDAEDSQNPGIQDFVGRGDLTLSYNSGRNTVYAIASSPVLPKHIERGNLQVNWVYRISGNLRSQFQLTTGYGDSLVDYNHRQTTLGLGLAFVAW